MKRKYSVKGLKAEYKRAAIWRKSHPWARFVEWARRRVKCRDERGWYPFYGAKGIECHLTAKQLEEIWTRDKAVDLKRASLDRINSMYDYANWNVRFIEFELNSRMAWDKNLSVAPPEEAPVYT